MLFYIPRFQSLFSKHPIVFCVGTTRFSTGSKLLLKAFASTVSYRLEPKGWGSRFPVLLEFLKKKKLHTNGRIQMVAEALSELQIVEKELAGLSPKQAIWDFQDTRPRDDSFQDVNHQADSLLNYFMISNKLTKLTLVSQLKEIFKTSQHRQSSIRPAWIVFK